MEDPSFEGETERQRLNRNFAELLQEVRVAETGVQILFAFLLTLPFTNRFTVLVHRDVTAYVIAAVSAAAATIILVAPVSLHRIWFRTGRKLELVAIASALAQVGLLAFGVALVSAGFFVADVVLGLGWGIGSAILLAVLEISLWYVLPLAHRSRGMTLDDVRPEEAGPPAKAARAGPGKAPPAVQPGRRPRKPGSRRS